MGWCAAVLLCGVGLRAQDAPASQQQTAPPPEQRIARQKAPREGALQGMLLNEKGGPLPAVQVELRDSGTDTMVEQAQSEGDGIFRLLQLAPGNYDLVFTSANGAAPVKRSNIRINPGEVLSIEVHLAGFAAPLQGAPVPQNPTELAGEGAYKELARRPDANGALIGPKTLELPPESDVFQRATDRWETEFPVYHRYEGMETPYVAGHWYDPFNRNRFKGDLPSLFAKTFINFTGDAITAMDGRRLPLKSGQSAAGAGEYNFFGKGGQFFIAQTFRASLEIFHGDTMAFRPVDWRIRITPAGNLNYLAAQENQVVSPDVLHGTTRFDGHGSLQEAFGEVKLADIGPNYDFVNVRAGIQQFVSDFRGFIFADEQPGVRLFGNLKSNRYQWNLAGFDLLEKNTNSGLNTFTRRGREVAIANVFIQDAGGLHGYTTQFSYHFVRDDGNLHYDDNSFLVRPAPIGLVLRHRIDADYFGWTGDGHIGRTNITHAFYQVNGNDSVNEFATGAKGAEINAQFAALELSRDYDWLRLRLSALYASGDDNPLSGTERGFDSIVDAEAFAGGEFSFFNRESIRLTGTGVALTPGDSFLPDLRSSKDEGQSNFVNPGLQLYNVGADAKVTQKLKLIGNVNFLQFNCTQPLVFLLQQNGIKRTIGTDGSLGVVYRPLLSDNIVITGGGAALVPSSAFRDFYTSQTLFSVFTTVRFQF
jgi:hypothetical protein